MRLIGYTIGSVVALYIFGYVYGTFKDAEMDVYTRGFGSALWGSCGYEDGSQRPDVTIIPGLLQFAFLGDKLSEILTDGIDDAIRHIYHLPNDEFAEREARYERCMSLWRSYKDYPTWAYYLYYYNQDRLPP